MYKHGFMFKEVIILKACCESSNSSHFKHHQVKVDTFLHTGEANPRLNELAMFRESKRNDGDHGYDEEEEEEEDNYAGGTQNIMKELAKQVRRSAFISNDMFVIHIYNYFTIVSFFFPCCCCLS